MRKSKYLGTTSGDWVCTNVGVAYVQPAFKQKKVDGKRVRSKSPGHQQYEYTYERKTSDLKAMKIVKLNASQANKVLRGLMTVEDYAKKKAEKRSQKTKERICYSFCD